MEIPFAFTLYQVISVAGFLFYLIAYVCLITGMFAGTSTTYIVLNIVAPALILVSLIEDFNIGSLLIQITWITIGIIKLFHIVWRTSFDTQRASTGVNLEAMDSTDICTTRKSIEMDQKIGKMKGATNARQQRESDTNKLLAPFKPSIQ